MGSLGLHLLSTSQKFQCFPHQPTSFSLSPFFQNCFSSFFKFQILWSWDWLILTCFCKSSIDLCLLFFNIIKGLSSACIVQCEEGHWTGSMDDFRGVVFLDVGKWWICRPCNTGFVIWDLPEKSLQRINLDIWDKSGTFWTVLGPFRLLFYGNVNQIVKRLKIGSSQHFPFLNICIWWSGSMGGPESIKDMQMKHITQPPMSLKLCACLK